MLLLQALPPGVQASFCSLPAKGEAKSIRRKKLEEAAHENVRIRSKGLACWLLERAQSSEKYHDRKRDKVDKHLKVQGC